MIIGAFVCGTALLSRPTAQERLAEARLAGGPLVRRAWELRIDQELSYKEAAAQLGLPVGTVGTMIHRLRQSSRAPVVSDSATSE